MTRGGAVCGRSGGFVSGARGSSLRVSSPACVVVVSGSAGLALAGGFGLARVPKATSAGWAGRATCSAARRVDARLRASMSGVNSSIIFFSPSRAERRGCGSDMTSAAMRDNEPDRGTPARPETLEGVHNRNARARTGDLPSRHTHVTETHRERMARMSDRSGSTQDDGQRPRLCGAGSCHVYEG